MLGSDYAEEAVLSNEGKRAPSEPFPKELGAAVLSTLG